jgi:hypothetical protein
LEKEEKLVNLAFVLTRVPIGFAHDVEQLVSKRGFQLVFMKKAPVSVKLMVLEKYPEMRRKSGEKEGENNGESRSDCI